MTFTEAAVEVLRLIGKPLHYKRITEIAIERNLLSHVGKTPEITMSSRLATMVKKDRGDAPIIKVKPGIFGLRDFPEEVLQSADLEAVADAESEGEIPEEIAEAGAPESPSGEATEEPAAAPVSEKPRKPARPERKLPGTEVFPEEEDDDEPILAKLDEESAERDEDGGKKRKRRRRRRGGEEREGVEAADGGERGGSERGGREHHGFREGERDRDRDRDRDRGRDRGRDRDRDRGQREERQRDDRRRELPGDWHREPENGEVVGKELSDAIAGALEALGGPRARLLTRVADELVRRGRLSGDPLSLVPTIAASARGDDAKREAKQQRPRFRIQGDEIALVEWALPNDAARIEREVEQAARRQRDLVRRAFVRRVSELPTAAFMELLATWLNTAGVTALRGIRRPGAASGELHLAGVLKQGPLETPIAIVILRDGASVGREKVVEIRGALHHYGNASAAWLITLGQVLSGAREEAQAPGAAPCALFDGQELARSMEEARIGLRTYVVPVVGLDVDLLDALRGPGARPQPQQQPQPRRDREPEPAARVEPREPREPVEAAEVAEVAGSAEVVGSAEGEEDQAGNGGGRRRRRRRRRRGGGGGEDAQRAEALGAVAGDVSEDDEGTLEGAAEPEFESEVDDGPAEAGSVDEGPLGSDEAADAEDADDEVVDEERVSEPGEIPEEFEPIDRLLDEHDDDERDIDDDERDMDEPLGNDEDEYADDLERRPEEE